MPIFKMLPTTGDASQIVSAALGATVNAADKFGTNDRHKVVKLGGPSRYVPAAAGDEIEAFVDSVESYTVNGGYSFGGVQTGGRKEVVVENAYTIGALVVSGTNTAQGTAFASDRPNVRVPGTAPTKFLWRVVDGTGGAGSNAVIERI